MQRGARGLQGFGGLVVLVSVMVIGCRSTAPVASSEHRAVAIDAAVVAPNDGARVAPVAPVAPNTVNVPAAPAAPVAPIAPIAPAGANAVAVPAHARPGECVGDPATVRACQAEGPNFTYGWQSEIRCQGIALPDDDKTSAPRGTCGCYDRRERERELDRCSMVK